MWTLCLGPDLILPWYFSIMTHCVKGVRIQSYSGPHFSVFGLHMERYAVSVRIQSLCGKMRTRITPNTGNFHAVTICNISTIFFLLSTKDKAQKTLNTAESYLQMFKEKTLLNSQEKMSESPFLISYRLQMSATLLKKILWHRCFPVKFAKFLRTPFLRKTPVAAFDINLILLHLSWRETLQKVEKVSKCFVSGYRGEVN